MSKIPKNYITVIALSVISLILGGTFFVISQNGSKQGSVQNSTQSSSSSQNSNFSTSSANSTNPNSPLEGWSQSERGVSLSQNSTISSQFSNPVSSSNSQQSLSSSSSSQNSSPNLLSNQASNSQTYTNPNYPNLKINYDNSWKLDIQESSSEYLNLPVTYLVLSKDNIIVDFNFYPRSQTYQQHIENIVQSSEVAKILNNNIMRIKDDMNPFYTSDRKTNIIYIKSNLPGNNYPDYKVKTNNEGDMIEYIVQAGVRQYMKNCSNSPCIENITNFQLLEEVDEIIKNSILE